MQHIQYYFSKNLIEYLKAFIVFVIGIVIAIIVMNNSEQKQKIEIKDYIDNKINIVKTTDDYNSGTFSNILKENTLEIIVLAFLASTIIGIPFAYFMIAKKGFSIGYTIAAIYATQNTKTATIFICISMLIHNIIYMISMVLVFTEGNNLVKTMIDKDRNNIKFNIFRYIIFVVIALIMVVLSTVYETYISKALLDIFKKYL